MSTAVAWVYILYSPTLQKYYIGETKQDIEFRLNEHNDGVFKNKYTARGKPWTLFLTIECQNLQQAIQIEKHLKAMKSKVYLENLSRYPEMITKLKDRFPL